MGDKIIRDVIHGDIVFDKRFLSIVDTPEFQRLNRIRQLSTEFFVFPSAQHTRFSHSIGTYYVMQRMIERFQSIFKEIDIVLGEKEMDTALAAALLHDIGHGPFSHSFESALPGNKKQHEQWTAEIIMNQSTGVHWALKENFGDDFPEQVKDLIQKNHAMKSKKPEPTNGIDFSFVMSSLVSSQLDADRMDYLLRDAFFTGTTLGKFDLYRLIQSIEFFVQENNCCVCVKEKYLSALEEYLLARYHMYDNIYLHPFKIEMEQVTERILLRAQTLFREDKLNKDIVPLALQEAFSGEEITLENYLKLDDAVLIAFFSNLRDHRDETIQYLCRVFFERRKFQRIDILGNQSEQNIKEFRSHLQDALQDAGYVIRDLDQEYFFLSANYSNAIYKHEKNNEVHILKSDGTVGDVLDISSILHENLKDTKRFVFIHLDILKKCYSGDFDMIKQEVENLIRSYDCRSHIEIEKKYTFSQKEIFSRIKQQLKITDEKENGESWNKYRYVLVKTSNQTDKYYDTDENMLLKEKCSLRTRKREHEDGYILTIKSPVPGQTNQQERFEYEMKLVEDDISAELSRDFIKKHIAKDDEFDPSTLRPILSVENKRQKIILTKGRVNFEMVFDDVHYRNLRNNREGHEYQVEIEVKSDYLHRVNLQQLTKYLEENIKELAEAADYQSKYQHGMALTE